MRRCGRHRQSGEHDVLLLWYYTCVTLEKIDPLEGRVFAAEVSQGSAAYFAGGECVCFYPRYLADLLMKHITLAGLVWRYGKLRRQLKRDPAARSYTDLALTPVTDDDSEEFVTSGHGHAKAAW